MFPRQQWPDDGSELFDWQCGNASRYWKPQQIRDEPVASRTAPIIKHFRKIDRNVVRQKRMLQSCPSHRDVRVGFGKLLDIVIMIQVGIRIALGQSAAKHVQQNRGVLRIILVPRVMNNLAISRSCNRRDQAHFKPFNPQPVRQCPMIISRCFESNPTRLRAAVQIADKSIVFLTTTCYAKLSSGPMAGLNDCYVAILRDVDGNPGLNV